MKKTVLLLSLLLFLTGCATTNVTVDEQPSALEPESQSIEVSEIKASEIEFTQIESIEAESLPESQQELPPFSYEIVMVGDVLLHTRVEESCKEADGSYDYHWLFEKMEDEISSADLAIVNQEVILGGIDLGVSGYPAFNAPFSVADALVDSGFDVVCHGTNHALDKRSKGLLNCLQSWRETYPQIKVLGIHDSKEDQDAITYLDADGYTIAILNFTYGTNGIPLPEDMPYAVDLLDADFVHEKCKEARETADFVIVCPHWGTEYRLEADASQKRWCQIFLEEGVDLVLGTHPHVIEPIEWIENEDTGHKMLVYYSIGNFVNWTSGTGEGVANRMVGGMARIKLALDEAGKPYIDSYGVRALVSHVEYGPHAVTVYPLSEYTKELSDKNEIQSQDSNFSLDYCIDLADRVWGDLWN